MGIRFARWDLERNGASEPVLRIEQDGEILTDEGGADCFDDVLAASEAAWHLESAPPMQNSWLAVAHRALNAPSEGTLANPDHPRVVSSQDVAHGRVQWLKTDGGLTTSTGEWALAGPSGYRSGTLQKPPPPPARGNAPLSGEKTGGWLLVGRAVEAAGAPPPGRRPVSLEPPDDRPSPARTDLASQGTGEWPFASIAGRKDVGED